MPDTHFNQIYTLYNELDQICERHLICSPIEGASSCARGHYLLAGDDLERLKQLLGLYRDFHAPCSEANRNCRQEFNAAVDQAEQAVRLISSVKKKIDKLHSIQANNVIEMQLQKLDGIADALCRISEQDRAHLSEMSQRKPENSSVLAHTSNNYEIYRQIKNGLKYT